MRPNAPKDQSSEQQRNDYSLGCGVSGEVSLNSRFKALSENVDTGGSLFYSAVLQIYKSPATVEHNRTATNSVTISSKRKEHSVDSRWPHVARDDNLDDS